MSGKYPITRKGKKHPFKYFWHNGNTIRNKKELARILSLGIPPAYTNVKIYSPYKKIQATGVDAKGRIQYRYHPKWVQERDRRKFHNLIAFSEAYPKIKKAIARILPKKGPPRTKLQLVALATGLLNSCRIRPGHDRHLRDTGSYGATTLRKRHILITTDKTGKCLVLRFKGKSGVVNICKVSKLGSMNRVLTALLKTKKRPSDRIFKLPNGTKVSSKDINNFMRSVGSKDVSAKGFRTYHANIRFIQVITPTLTDKNIHNLTTRKRMIKHITRTLAEELHHTPSTFKKSYLYPGLREMYIEDPTKFKRLFCGKNPDKALSRFLQKSTVKINTVPKFWKDGRK